MKRIALYPGSFDPPTNGHLDLIQRALRTFDKVIIGIGVHNKKIPLFTLEEREALIHASMNYIEHIPRQPVEDDPARQQLLQRMGLISEADIERIKVLPFTNLVVEFAREVGAQFIIRGLRNVTDYQYEYQFAHMNTRMDPDIEHIYFMSGEADHFISSSIVKELWSFGDNYRTMVPEPVFRALENKRR